VAGGCRTRTGAADQRCRPQTESAAGRETVERLATAIRAAGAKLFFLVDHSGEAGRAGMTLPDTKLLVFGNPVAGTPAMVASPLVALDLPLKVRVWMDDDGAVWMS
jgi:uncharacterized protein (DUF302 family)